MNKPMKNVSWRKYLLTLDIVNDITNSKKSYRHGVKWIPISRIAQQYYCEMKVELSYKYGDVETKDKKKGKEIHGQVLAMEKADPQTLVERISTKEIYSTSFPLIAEIEGIIILGIPDLIVFHKEKPVYLVELKTTKSHSFRIWSNEVVQVKIYALALEHIGFDCSNLILW